MVVGARKLVPQTQASYVYEAIKGEILRGELRGGESILQADWADRMGTSVTPVREAIRRLAQDGLVETAPHRGTRVVNMTTSSLDEIYSMRALIEPILIRKSIGRLSENEARAARELCERMDTLRDDETAEFIELNAKFHETLMRHDDSWTSRIVGMLQDAASPYVALSIAEEPSQLKSSNKDHFLMLDATIAGDAELAVEIELRHLDSTRVLAHKYLEQHWAEA